MSDWVVLVLPDDDHAPEVARRFVREHARALPSDLVQDAQLLVSELVTNAIRYGRPSIVVRLRSDPPALGIAVEDRGEQLPQLPADVPDPHAPTGRGMLLVDAIAQTWGIAPSQDPPGKAVWFDLAATPS